MGYDPRFVRFIVQFNGKRDYFECHELLEELWLEQGREAFLQGLLQIAVALYHFRNGNRAGASKLFRSALEKLKRYPGVTNGIDLDALRGEASRYLHRLERFEAEPFAFYDLSIRLVDPELMRLAEEEAASEAGKDTAP
jgi:hypothetical protein